jgi:hypothetical protein
MSESKCLYCEQSSDEAPLIAIHFHGEEWWICAQHLPLLIHSPAKLAGKLPGAENLGNAGHGH